MNNKQKCPVCGTHNVLVEDLKLEGKDTKSYLCLKCGYTSNSEYVTNSDIMNKMLDSNNTYSETLFNLHIYDEESGLYWFPMVLLHKEGAVFPEGTHDDFKWAYVPIIQIEPGDKEYGEDYNRRFAVELKEQFDKFDFLIACKKIGAIDPSLTVD